MSASTDDDRSSHVRRQRRSSLAPQRRPLAHQPSGLAHETSQVVVGGLDRTGGPKFERYQEGRLLDVLQQKFFVGAEIALPIGGVRPVVQRGIYQPQFHFSRSKRRDARRADEVVP